MELILTRNIEIPSVYGKVVESEDGTLKYSGEQRTGCPICGFGIIHDPQRFDRLKIGKPNLYKEMMRGGKWIRKNLYRWVKFRPGSIPIWSNLYWVPDEKGYGYRFVLNYFYKVMKINKYIEI